MPCPLDRLERSCHLTGHPADGTLDDPSLIVVGFRTDLLPINAHPILNLTPPTRTAPSPQPRSSGPVLALGQN